MALGIIALGHAGGVPGPYMGMVGNHGNTNFALVPNITDDIIEDALVFSRTGDKWDPISSILGTTPYWLIDCGPETALRLCGALGQPPATHNLQGIFITHCHDDHSGGLKSLAYRTKFVDNIRPMLVCPNEVSILDLLQHQLKEFEYVTASTPFGSGGTPYFYQGNFIPPNKPIGFANAGLHVTAFPVNHNLFMQRWQESRDPFPAYGYTITTEGGESITFSGDTAFPIPLEIIAKANTIVHDVQFYNDGSKKDHVHCPYAWLRDAVPPEHRRKVWLTHTGHELPPEVLADGFAGLFKQGRMMVLQ